MYTECPSCNTLFKVSTAQLKTAAGKVRCGRCNTVFNALERLTDELPDGVTNLTQPASEMIADSSRSSFDAVAIPGMDNDDFGEKAEDAFDFDLGAGLDDDAGTDKSLDTPGFSFDDEPASPAEKSATDSFFDLPDEVPDEPRDISATELEPPPDSLFAGLDEDIRMPEAGVNDQGADQARKIDRKKELESSSSDDPLDAVHQEFIRNDDDAEAYILEELKSSNIRSTSLLKNVIWIVVIVVLLCVMIVQFAYFKRADLALNPTFKPWVEKLCEVISPYVSCDVPQPVDLKAIKIIDKDVRSHPNSKKALLITATIKNEAEFDQPYPQLELRFSDINNKVIARRKFNPKEYLDKSADLTSLMQAGVPVRMMLEIVDPGSAAVNFTFEFLPLPDVEPVTEPAAKAKPAH